jgi:hypothetical protein
LGGADDGANGAALMAAEVIHDDNVARREDGRENLLDISAEACAVDRSVDDAGCRQTVATQRRQKREGPPSAEGRFGDTRWPLAHRPSVRVMLVLAQSLPPGLDPGGLVDEDKPPRIDRRLTRLPPLTRRRRPDGPVRRREGFFERHAFVLQKMPKRVIAHR